MKARARLFVSVIALAALSLTTVNAGATDFPITWIFGGSYPDLNIEENDTVTWMYTTSHNVWEFPDQAAFDTCDFSAATMVGDNGDSPLTIPFTAGTRFFGCAVGGHCLSGGMKMKVITSPPSLIFADGFESGNFDGWEPVAN